MTCGQIHPKLYAVQRTAQFGKFFFVIFRMNNAAGRRHPLHVAGANHAAVAGGIVMFHRTF